MAYDVWADRLRKTESVSYIDNEGARFSLIKGYCDSIAITRVGHHAAELFERGNMLVWHARVPSASNIADKPSRLIPSNLLPSTFQCSVQ